MNLLPALLILAALGLLAHFALSARRAPAKPPSSAWWLDAIEGPNAPTKRPG